MRQSGTQDFGGGAVDAEQNFGERGAGAEDIGFNFGQRHAEFLGDLLVGHRFEMIEDQRDALMAREFIEGAFDEGAAFVGVHGVEKNIRRGKVDFGGIGRIAGIITPEFGEKRQRWR